MAVVKRAKYIQLSGESKVNDKKKKKMESVINDKKG